MYPLGKFKILEQDKDKSKVKRLMEKTFMPLTKA